MTPRSVAFESVEIARAEIVAAWIDGMIWRLRVMRGWA